MDTKQEQKLYIAQAAAEYLIALLVEGTYLARLTSALGISDAVSGILHSVISLGNLFGLLSVLYRGQKVKRFVVVMSAANQLLFLSLYLLPLLGEGLPSGVKAGGFAVLIVLAYLLYYAAHPKKIGWLMGAVADRERGKFTANKEIVSLLCGIVFTFCMGRAVDRLTGKGEVSHAFVLCAAVILLLAVLHTVLLLLYPESEPAETEKAPPRSLLPLLKDRTVLDIAAVFAIWSFAQRCAIPFYGTYMLHELGLSQTRISLLAAIGSTVRILTSRFFGKYADKHSFNALLQNCFALAALAFTSAAFAAPSTGTVCFTLYHFFYGMSMAGINSSMINLIFDLVPAEKRMDALALSHAVAGGIGFLSTVLFSPLVDRIQKDGNRFLGLPFYAQQVLSVFSAVLTLCALFYVRRMLERQKGRKTNDHPI